MEGRKEERFRKRIFYLQHSEKRLMVRFMGLNRVSCSQRRRWRVSQKDWIKFLLNENGRKISINYPITKNTIKEENFPFHGHLLSMENHFLIQINLKLNNEIITTRIVRIASVINCYMNERIIIMWCAMW